MACPMSRWAGLRIDQGSWGDLVVKDYALAMSVGTTYLGADFVGPQSRRVSIKPSV